MQAPNRKRRLQTFSEKGVTRQKVTQLESDRKLILQCMRKKMRWSKLTGQPIERSGEQLLEIPLAQADHQGNPNKGQKAYMTKALETMGHGEAQPVPHKTVALSSRRTLPSSARVGEPPVSLNGDCPPLYGTWSGPTRPTRDCPPLYGAYAALLGKRKAYMTKALETMGHGVAQLIPHKTLALSTRRTLPSSARVGEPLSALMETAPPLWGMEWPNLSHTRLSPSLQGVRCPPRQGLESPRQS